MIYIINENNLFYNSDFKIETLLITRDNIIQPCSPNSKGLFSVFINSSEPFWAVVNNNIKYNNCYYFSSNEKSLDFIKNLKLDLTKKLDNIKSILGDVS